MDAGALVSSGAGFGISSRGQKRKIRLFINRFSARKIVMQPQRGGLAETGFALNFLLSVCVCFHPCGSLFHLSVIVFCSYPPQGNNRLTKLLDAESFADMLLLSKHARC